MVVRLHERLPISPKLQPPSIVREGGFSKESSPPPHPNVIGAEGRDVSLRLRRGELQGNITAAVSRLVQAQQGIQAVAEEMSGNPEWEAKEGRGCSVLLRLLRHNSFPLPYITEHNIFLRWHNFETTNLEMSRGWGGSDVG